MTSYVLARRKKEKKRKARGGPGGDTFGLPAGPPQLTEGKKKKGKGGGLPAVPPTLFGVFNPFPSSTVEREKRRKVTRNLEVERR